MFKVILDKPKIILFVIILISIAAIPFALKVKPRNTIEGLAIQSDPAFLLIEEIKQKFKSSDEIITIAIDNQETFLNPTNLSQLNRLTIDLENVDSIDKVIGLTNLKTVSITQDSIAVNHLITSLDNISDEQKRIILEDPFYENLFISNDGKATILIATLKSLGSDQIARKSLVKKIDAVLDQYKDQHKNSNWKFYQSGTLYLNDHTNAVIDKDNKTVMPLTFLVIGLFLYLIYRRRTFVVIPFIITLLSIFWTIAVMGIMGSHLTAFTSLVPLVLLTISLCDSVHIFNAIWNESIGSTGDKSRHEIILSGLKKVFLPCLLTTITTMVGFFSLTFSDMNAVREVGGYTGIGALFAFILSITIIPMALSKANFDKDKEKIDRNYQRISDAMGSLGKKVLTSPRLILGIGLMISLIAITGLFQIEVGQKAWGVFAQQTSFKDTHRFFKEKDVGASGEIDIILRGPPGSFLDSKILSQVSRMQNDLTKTPVSKKTFSLLNVYALITGKLEKSSPLPTLSQPEIDSGIALASLSQDPLFSSSEYMTEDAATFRIKDFISFVDSSQETLRAEQLKREVVERYLPEGFTYELTSRPIIWAHVIHRIVDSQVINFIFAFVFICLLIGLIFRSLRIGLISMIPNMLPILVAFGLLGWLKIPLNAFTAMTACVAIGLVVDDTIHFISYFRNEIEKGIPTRASLLATFENVGFPITITSSILAIGCSLFYFSGLTTTAEFGLLVSAICILALLADLFLLAPILLLTHEPSLSQKS